MAGASGALTLANHEVVGRERAHGALSSRPTVTVLSRGNGHGDYAATLAALQSYMSQHVAEYGLPGMTLCAADRDGFAATIDVGCSDCESPAPIHKKDLFQIGSITKSFTSICMLRAVSLGKLALGDEVRALLPGIPLGDTGITVRHLLSHTSGLAEDVPIVPRGVKEQLWTGFAPGSHFSYSNSGYVILGAILEKVLSQTYEEIVRKLVLEPLGMTQTRAAIRVADQGQYARGYWPYFSDRPFAQGGRLAPAYFTEFTKPSGCIASTASDMSRYVRYLIEAGSGRGAPLLSDRDARLFTTPVTDAPVYGPQAKYAFGLGLVPIDGNLCLHHTGGMTSFSSAIHVDPHNGVGAFVSTNATIGAYRPRDVSYFACQLMSASRKRSALPAPPRIELDDEIDNPGEYAGRYRSAAGETLVLEADRKQLVLRFEDRRVLMRRLDIDAFLAPHPRFERLPLVADRQGGNGMSFWWGETCFSKGVTAQSTPCPPELARCAGYYSSNDPWVGDAYVFARSGQLWLNGTKPLFPQPDGTLRAGADPLGCERVSFDSIVNGVPQRLQLSGIDLDRDTPNVPGAFARS